MSCQFTNGPTLMTGIGSGTGDNAESFNAQAGRFASTTQYQHPCHREAVLEQFALMRR